MSGNVGKCREKSGKCREKSGKYWEIISIIAVKTLMYLLHSFSLQTLIDCGLNGVYF